MAASDRERALGQALVDAGADPERAARIAAALLLRLDNEPCESVWAYATRTLLDTTLPFAAHKRVHEWVFAAWDVTKHGPPPAFIPTPEDRERSNAAALLRARGTSDFSNIHTWSITAREDYWAWAIRTLGIRFQIEPERILDDSEGPESVRWLPGARYNIADSCFSADPEATAIIWDRPGQPVVRTSYRTLRARADRVMRALKFAGFTPGDAVAIDMPMTPEAVEIYLALVLGGMTVVSIADSMAAEEVATRLRIAGAKGLFTVFAVQRGGKHLPLYEKLLAIAPPVTIVLEAQGAALRAGDRTWEEFLSSAGPDSGTHVPVVMRDADAITNVLFSSGTTGEPKAIPWTQTTPIKAAIDGHVHLDIRPGDVVAWPTNLGWMMGPWLIYASLLNRATIALYGDAPTLKDFGRFVADAGVTMLGVVPSIVKAWRSDDRMLGFDWSSIRCFGSTGEASNSDDYFYLMMLAGYRPVIEYCGGTELGGAYITGSLVQPQAPATFSTPALGSEFVLLDDQGQPTNNGEVFLVPPTLGYSQRLLNRDHHAVYFEGTPTYLKGVPLRRHGDQIERLAGGYFRAHGRVDDTMNLGGIKVSSAEIERVLDTVDGVARTAAIAITPPGGGPSELVVYVVMAPRPSSANGPTSANTRPAAQAELHARLQSALKSRLNPLFRITDVVLCDALPVTASNKILRRELRAKYRRGGHPS